MIMESRNPNTTCRKFSKFWGNFCNERRDLQSKIMNRHEIRLSFESDIVTFIGFYANVTHMLHSGSRHSMYLAN